MIKSIEADQIVHIQEVSRNQRLLIKEKLIKDMIESTKLSIRLAPTLRNQTQIVGPVQTQDRAPDLTHQKNKEKMTNINDHTVNPKSKYNLYNVIATVPKLTATKSPSRLHKVQNKIQVKTKLEV